MRVSPAPSVAVPEKVRVWPWFPLGAVTIPMTGVTSAMVTVFAWVADPPYGSVTVSLTA